MSESASESRGCLVCTSPHRATDVRRFGRPSVQSTIRAASPLHPVPTSRAKPREVGGTPRLVNQEASGPPVGTVRDRGGLFARKAGGRWLPDATASGWGWSQSLFVLSFSPIKWARDREHPPRSSFARFTGLEKAFERCQSIIADQTLSHLATNAGPFHGPRVDPAPLTPGAAAPHSGQTEPAARPVRS